MNEKIDLVKNFHNKFKVPVLEKPSLIPEERFQLRYKLMRDEVEEYLKGAENGDIKNIAKELCDILYAVYGTILEHGLQDTIQDVFKEVSKSNMSKDYSEFKMKKGENYFEPDVDKFFK